MIKGKEIGIRVYTECPKKSLKLFLGHPVDDHENDQRRMNTNMIYISRYMLLNDLTSEPRDVFELYRATTDPRIDAKGVMPIPGWLVVSIHA